MNTASDKALRPGSPREEWVIGQPDGFVLRRRVPHGERGEYEAGSLNGGWWQSSLTTLAIAQLAAQRCGPTYMIYAARADESGEQHLALVTRERLAAMR